VVNRLSRCRRRRTRRANGRKQETNRGTDPLPRLFGEGVGRRGRLPAVRLSHPRDVLEGPPDLPSASALRRRTASGVGPGSRVFHPGLAGPGAGVHGDHADRQRLVRRGGKRPLWQRIHPLRDANEPRPAGHGPRLLCVRGGGGSGGGRDFLHLVASGLEPGVAGVRQPDAGPGGGAAVRPRVRRLLGVPRHPRAVRSAEPGVARARPETPGAGFGLGIAACLLALVPYLNVLSIFLFIAWLQLANRAKNRLLELQTSQPALGAAAPRARIDSMGQIERGTSPGGA
jgi:hypothetical protein